MSNVWRAASAAALLFAFACQDGASPDASATPDPAVCEPDCSERVCGPDGCGGTCGDCPAGMACLGQGMCEADCSETCASLGWTCGEHCGTSCGLCGDGEACVGGACQCPATCSAATCEQADPCGGTCGPCAAAEPCDDCPLQLKVVETTEKNGVTTGFVVGLAYRGSGDAPRPVLADVRLIVTGPATLNRVGVGMPILDADKELRHDSSTGRPWIALEAGVIQTIVYSPRTAHPIADGEWLFWDFSIDFEGDAAPTQPVEVALVPRENILAPVLADQTLWGTALDKPIVVWAR